ATRDTPGGTAPGGPHRRPVTLTYVLVFPEPTPEPVIPTRSDPVTTSRRSRPFRPALDALQYRLAPSGYCANPMDPDLITGGPRTVVTPQVVNPMDAVLVSLPAASSSTAPATV